MRTSNVETSTDCRSISLQAGDRSAEKSKAQSLERKRKEEKQRRDRKKGNTTDREEEGGGFEAVGEEDDELLCDPEFTFIKKRERMPLEELRVR
jgi:hypothetical protein